MIEAVDLWLDSLQDSIALSNDAMWHESTALPDIPSWVREANIKLDRTLFAPVTTTFDELKLTPYRAGYAMGLLRWSMKSLQPDIPPALNTILKRARISTRTRRKIGKRFEVFLLKGGFITRAELRRSQFIPARALRYEANATKLPLHELAEFHDGMAAGLRGVGPKSPGDKSDPATEIHQILVTWWRLVVRLKSVTELHAWLVRLLGEPKVGDKKRVEKICERIGLTLREPGRPKEIPTLALPG